MNPDSIIELATLNAVGAMSHEADGMVQELLSAADAGVVAEAVRLQEDAALMAVAQTAARKPPSALKGRILARL